MEIGGLRGDPAQEACHFVVFEQSLAVIPEPRQFGIGKNLVDRLVTDRMDGDGLAPLLRFGDRMVLLHAAAEGTAAQPAKSRRFCQPFFSAAFFFFIVS